VALVNLKTITTKSLGKICFTQNKDAARISDQRIGEWIDEAEKYFNEYPKEQVYYITSGDTLLLCTQLETGTDYQLSKLKGTYYIDSKNKPITNQEIEQDDIDIRLDGLLD